MRKESHSRERSWEQKSLHEGEREDRISRVTDSWGRDKGIKLSAIPSQSSISIIQSSLSTIYNFSITLQKLLQLSKWFLSSLSSAPSPLLPLCRPARLSWSQFLLTLLLEPLVDALAPQVVLLEVSLLLSPIPNVRSMRLMRSRLDLSAVLKGSLTVPSTIGSSATINSLALTSTSKARALAVSGFIFPQCSKAPFQANKYIQPLLSAVCPRLVWTLQPFLLASSTRATRFLSAAARFASLVCLTTMSTRCRTLWTPTPRWIQV